MFGCLWKHKIRLRRSSLETDLMTLRSGALFHVEDILQTAFVLCLLLNCFIPSVPRTP